MKSRPELQTKLESVNKVKKVYFQPPENVKLLFPCIVYKWDGGTSRFADNGTYHFRRRYTLIVIDSNPDTTIPEDLIKQFNMYIRLERTYTADNLHHYVFTLYW